MHKTKPTYTFPNLQAKYRAASISHTIWQADITEIKLTHGKVYIFLAIDIQTNLIIAHTLSHITLKAPQITQALQRALDQRHSPAPVLIHTDQGTQFTSKEYHEFIQLNAGKVIGSMSSAAARSNQVIERFNRTFKSHRIKGISLPETLEIDLDPTTLTQKYVDSLNNTPNSKTNGLSPIQLDSLNNTPNSKTNGLPPIQCHKKHTA